MRRITAVSPVLLLLVLVLVLLGLCPTSQAQVAISVSFGPPALPVYEQPVCPNDGYIWTPGYWAWDADYDDYYWVPGTWVLAPEPGFLWTPPWWGWENGAYLFHAGWWGPTIGFYGGIDYGFGYPGAGFYGGRWDHDHFFYNRTVTNVNVTVIHNVYNETVVNRNVTVNHVSYNGGPGGIQARATAQEEAAGRERHVGPVAAQTEHVQTARSNPQLRATENHGRPPIAATAKPTDFHGNVVAAREAGGEYHPPANRAQGNRGAQPENRGAQPENRPAQPEAEKNASRPPVHPNELPAMQHQTAPNTGNAARDQKYQQQQEKLFARQQQQRQQLQQRQEQEHQRAQKGNANQGKTQQMEQRHQQQTQHLQQQQQQQVQHMQQRQGGNPKR